jgi:hypothetical protein
MRGQRKLMANNFLELTSLQRLLIWMLMGSQGGRMDSAICMPLKRDATII